MEEEILETIRKRDKLFSRLMKSLEHLPIENQLAIVTSFMSTDELEKLTTFQERTM